MKVKIDYVKVVRGVVIMIDLDSDTDDPSNVDHMSRRSYRPRAVAIGR